MAETRRNNLPITTVSTNSVVNTAVNLFTYANELLDYSDGYIHDYECEEDIRYRIYKLQCLDDTISRVVIFTNENGAYYSAIEVEGEWIEFTILNSTKEKDTIRFNTRSHQHFYADDYSLMECGDTPLSKLLLGLFDMPHIGEMIVYDTLELAKDQGLL